MAYRGPDRMMPLLDLSNEMEELRERIEGSRGILGEANQHEIMAYVASQSTTALLQQLLALAEPGYYRDRDAKAMANELAAAYEHTTHVLGCLFSMTGGDHTAVGLLEEEKEDDELCGVPALALGPCDLSRGHGGLHVSAGDGFSARCGVCRKPLVSGEWGPPPQGTLGYACSDCSP